MTRTLVARLDSDGDVLLTGPALRAVAAGSDHVTLLVSPSGEQAARLLPGVDEIIVWACPWTGFVPPPFDGADVLDLVERLRAARPDVAVVLTSDHQSPLPLAVLLRLAGVPRIVGSSHDYPGSLLDVRHPPGGTHEVERNLSLVAAAGFTPSVGDTGRLRLRGDLPTLRAPLATLAGRYVVLHPTASVPARSLAPAHAAELAGALCGAGYAVVLTGTEADRPLADRLGDDVVSLVGRTSLAELAAVLQSAECAVTVNTGPAHLAAAVGTPTVCLFAPVVPVEAWRPWGVASVVLGDQSARCAGTRARACPVAGHPCLGGVTSRDVVAAVGRLSREDAA